MRLLLAAAAACAVAHAAISAVSMEAAVGADGTTLDRVLQAGNTQVNLIGFTQPVSLHWSPNLQHVYVAEKLGYIYKFNGFNAAKGDGQLVLDIAQKVFSYGDHGLTSVWIDTRPGEKWMYVTYMLEDPKQPNLKQTCADYGQMDGRPLNTVNGCKTFGRFSRWPLNDNGDIIGPEQVILNGLKKNARGSYLFCAQFSTHSVTSAAQSDIDPNWMFVAGGDGAAFTNADFGELGNNPCLDAPDYLGAYRCQDPLRMNGKVMRINLNNVVPDPNPDDENAAVAPTPWEVYSMGHRNSWRITVQNGQVWESETGWYMYEEINKIDQGKNYGWPCTEGPILSPHYNDPDEAGAPFHGNKACQDLVAGDKWERPFYAYAHPIPNPPHNVMSISAVMATDGFLLYGDYTQQTMQKVTNGGQDDQVVLRQASPVEIRKLPDATLAFVDYDQGTIKNLYVEGVTVPSASPSPAAVKLTVTSTAKTWTAGGGSTLTFSSNAKAFEGREGLIYDWNATLFSCPTAPTVCQKQVLVTRASSATLSLKAPATSGIIVIDFGVASYGGFKTTAQQLVIASTNAPACKCDGVPSTGGGGGSNGVGAADTNTGLSTGGIAGIAVAGGVVALAVVGAGVYAVMRRRAGSGGAVAAAGARAGHQSGGAAPAAGSRAGTGSAAAAGKPGVAGSAASSAASSSSAAGAGAVAAAGGASATDPKYKSQKPKTGLQTGTGSAAAAAAPQRTPVDARA